MTPHTEHDVWMRILGLLNNTDLRKSCNLACKAWHTYLQPLLLKSIVIDLLSTFQKEHELRVVEPLLDLSHLVRRLRLKNWPRHSASTPLPRSVITLPAMFRQLSQLELHDVWFGSYQNLHDCVFPPSIPIDTLLLNCVCDNLDVQYDSFAANSTTLMFDHSSSMDAAVKSDDQPLRLLSLSYNHPDDHDLFTTIVLRSLGLSSMLYTLRILRLEATCSTRGCLPDIFTFFRNPGCCVEELELDLYEPTFAIPIDDREYISTHYR
jgi:hypothetical protein